MATIYLEGDTRIWPRCLACASLGPLSWPEVCIYGPPKTHFTTYAAVVRANTGLGRAGFRSEDLEFF